MLFASLLVLLLLSLPLKFDVKKPFIVMISLCLIMSLSQFCYCRFVYENVASFENSDIIAECIVIESQNDCATVYFTKNDNDKNLGFVSNLFFEEEQNLIPSAKINVSVRFNESKRNSYGLIHISANADKVNIISEYDNDSIIYKYYNFRQKLSEVLTFDNKELSSFIRGILIGDTSEISGVLMNMFKTVGLSHIMSVSGMHLMFAVVFLNYVLIIFGVSHKKRALIGILSAIAFSFISGFAVSCIRSLIMIILFYYGVATDRISESLTSLSFSAFLIVCFSPFNILNISFVLSVLATFGMIVISPLINELIPINGDINFIANKFLHILRSAITIPLGANIACLPVFLFVFKQVSIISPVINLILITPIQLIFYLSFIVLLLPFGFVKTAISPILQIFYDFVLKIVKLCYNIKNTTVSDGNIYFYFVFVILLVLVFGIAWFKRNKAIKIIYPYILVYFLICLVIFTHSFLSSDGNVMLKFVDVGQGSCSVVSKDESAVIIDCGGDYYNEVQNELRRSNVKRIELIAITHADYDHIGFLDRILNTYEVDKIIFPVFANKDNLSDIIDIAKSNDVEIIELSKDLKFDVLGFSTIEAFVEKAYLSKPTENTSALYKFSYYDNSVCFTGDMSLGQEYVYQKYGEKLNCDVLLVPHHGSFSSSYKGILELYSPDISIISVASDNKYNLPDKRVVDRLEQYSDVLTTADVSTVIFKLNKKGYEFAK